MRGLFFVWRPLFHVIVLLTSERTFKLLGFRYCPSIGLTPGGRLDTRRSTDTARFLR